MIPVKLTNIGGSIGVILPVEILVKLRVKEGDTIFLAEASEGCWLASGDAELARQTEVAGEVMRENREVLRALSK